MYIVSDSSSIWFQGFWVKQGRLIGQLLCKLRPTSDTWFTGTGTPYHRLQYAQPFWHVWSIQMLREDCVHVNFVAVTWKPENHHHVTDADTHQRDILYPNKHESGEMTQTWKQTSHPDMVCWPLRPLWWPLQMVDLCTMFSGIQLRFHKRYILGCGGLMPFRRL